MTSQKSKLGFRPFGGAGAAFGSQGTGSNLSYLAKPPDLNAISDPNAVVLFKNLLKKDSTTKTKALEDLVVYAAAHPFEKDGGVDEAVLGAWIELYPRISIDGSRRVRELSHSFQFELMKSARKRMERHIPKIVGSWLIGLYDKDRAVSRAASEGLSSFLKSPEKAAQFWKKCQSYLLEFATAAIQETKDTLSDERTTTAEDADAKYFRVINAALCLLCSLLTKVNDEDRDRLREKYDLFFEEDAVWRSIGFQDTQVRKSACQLMLICLEKRKGSLEAQTSRIKKEFVVGGLKEAQMNSAVEFVKSLAQLTNAFPQIWGKKGESEATSGKKEKTPFPNLLSFLAAGSHGCPAATYWEAVEQLLRAVSIPAKFVFDTAHSMRIGVGRESKLHSKAAWMSYVHVCRRLLDDIMDESKVQFASKFLRPLLGGGSDTRRAEGETLQQPSDIDVVQECYTACISDSTVASATNEWINEMGASLAKRLAEKTTDDAVAKDATHWFSLAARVQRPVPQAKPQSGKVVATPFDVPSEKVVKACVEICGESPEAKVQAMILRQAVEMTTYLEANKSIRDDLILLLEGIARNKMDRFILAPSLKDLLACLQAFSQYPALAEVYTHLWNELVRSLLELPPSAKVTSTMTILLSGKDGAVLGKEHDAMKKYVMEQSTQCILGKTEDWRILETAITCGMDNNGLLKTALQLLQGHTPTALRALSIISRHATTVTDVELLQEAHSRMLLLSEGDDATASKAQEVLTLLENANGKKPLTTTLKENLEKAGPFSLGVNTLVKLALEGQDSLPFEAVLPDTTLWRTELSANLSSINPCLSMISYLGGAQHAVQKTSKSVVRRDRKGYSIPLRMAMYVSMLLHSGKDLSSLPRDVSKEIVLLLLATVEIASDQRTVQERASLFVFLSSPAQQVAHTFITATRDWLTNLVERESHGSILDEFADYFLDQSHCTPLGYYCARASFRLVQTMTFAWGVSPRFEELLAKASVDSKSNPLPTVALLRGTGIVCQVFDGLNKLCNSLVSNIMGVKPGSEQAIPILAMLTATLRCYIKGSVPVQTNRLVFAVKTITGWFEADEELSPEIATEACRVLIKILPELSSIYGPHWETTLEFCTKLWMNAHKHALDDAIPVIDASLELYTVLEEIEEPNDDLEDALKQCAQAKATGLLQLLHLPRPASHYRPLETVAYRVCRQIKKLPLRLVQNPSDLYEHMVSESTEIQETAFTILHKALPAAQQQISVDTLLDKKTAQLPDELLSLLLEHPTLERWHNSLSFYPTNIRSYLLSWRLIFDAYSEATLNVRNDYTENLKSEDYVPPLLDFMFDVLGHTAGNALKLDKEGIGEAKIRKYDIHRAGLQDNEKNMHWLMAHLFYLVLKYVPELFKTWYINCRSKQTKMAIDPWLSKFYSPLIIPDMLDDVAKWADAQEPGKDDEKELLIKVNRNAREVSAGYEVDEEIASILVKIPKTYPIEGIVVEGTNRAVAGERKWQSWLMTTQGVIAFSNGSIIDGLLTFRRNIIGELKGQSECAICYSIMSTDKRMADKRCQTCKNLFHRACLYKWLQTSNQNTCPLCRTPIDFAGRDTRRRPQI